MSQQPSSSQDPRRRGFVQRHGVDEVCQWLDGIASVLVGKRLQTAEREEVALSCAAGRQLAEDLISPVDLPGYDRAMMDGFAVRSADIQGASFQNAIELNVIGTCRPGQAADQDVPTGGAIEIATGAAIPLGADCVVPYELTEPTTTELTADPARIRVVADIARRKNIATRGEDLQQGQVLLPRGRRLRPTDVGLLSALGLNQVCVLAQPRVRLLITGNEIVQPGAELGPGQIYDANTPTLQNLVARDGGTLETSFTADNPLEIQRLLAETEADLLLVSGGSSVGPEDFAPQVLRELGELKFHGLAMRPSSPTGIGRIEDRVVILLPGNPVSCVCAYEFFAGRTLRQLGGGSAAWPHRRIAARVHDDSKISSVLGRVDYCRVQLDATGRVRPLGIGGASLLSSLSRADGFVIVGEDSEGHAAGTPVDVLLY